MSKTPPLLNEIIGTPSDKASIETIPKVSCKLVETRALLLLTRFKT